jgi:hypothetical protein
LFFFDFSVSFSEWEFTSISYSVQENEIRKDRKNLRETKLEETEKNEVKWEKEARLIAGVLNPH